jgi:hypothetical protein
VLGRDLSGIDLVEMFEALDEFMRDMFSGNNYTVVTLGSFIPLSGMNQSQQVKLIRGLPRPNPFDKDNDGGSCAICQEGGKPEERLEPIQLGILKCNHVTHLYCLYEMREKMATDSIKIKCPNCTLDTVLVATGMWYPKVKKERKRPRIIEMTTLAKAAQSCGMAEEEYKAQCEEQKKIAKARKAEAEKEAILKQRREEKARTEAAKREREFDRKMAEQKKAAKARKAATKTKPGSKNQKNGKK